MQEEGGGYRDCSGRNGGGRTEFRRRPSHGRDLRSFEEGQLDHRAEFSIVLERLCYYGLKYRDDLKGGPQVL